jgi:hypothetical protein
MKTKTILITLTSLIASAVFAFDPPPVGNAAPDFWLRAQMSRHQMRLNSITAPSKIFGDIQADLLPYIGRRRVASALRPQIHIVMRLA